MPALAATRGAARAGRSFVAALRDGAAFIIIMNNVADPARVGPRFTPEYGGQYGASRPASPAQGMIYFRKSYCLFFRRTVYCVYRARFCSLRGLMVRSSVTRGR